MQVIDGAQCMPVVARSFGYVHPRASYERTIVHPTHAEPT